MEKVKGINQSSMNPKHKQYRSIQGRSHLRHKGGGPHESIFEQNRCRSANLEFHWHRLDNKKKLVEDCGPVAKALLIECKKVIIVWDLYPAWREKGIKPCRHEDRLAIFQSLQAENVELNKVFLVCIQEELEAWLLADYRAVTAMLKPLKHPHVVGRILRFTNPDSIRNPKVRLNKIFTQELGLRRRYVDYQHAIMLAREIPNFNKIRRSDSFKRFALKVAGLEL